MPSILDLFSGCGGLSLGAHNAGFSTALAIDSDEILTSSFAMNFPKARLLRADVRMIGASALKGFFRTASMAWLVGHRVKRSARSDYATIGILVALWC